MEGNIQILTYYTGNKSQSQERIELHCTNIEYNDTMLRYNFDYRITN